MSCTIISTPATGSQDWTDWIIQQGLTDRGFSRISLTNFAGTAASSIGTGAVFELAGSIYNNTTETAISLATGTASADVAVYIMAIPAAGGTTCTFQIDSTAPTWVDAKQGFYASAASTTRAVGGMYIGTAATYYHKYLYTPEMLSGYLLPSGETRPILKRIYDMGEWNMDATTTLTIVHGLPSIVNIRSLQATIRNDTGMLIQTSTFAGLATGDVDIQVACNTNTLNIVRLTGGFFDSTGYNATASTVANRGWFLLEID